jgi:hypothetical protein
MAGSEPLQTPEGDESQVVKDSAYYAEVRKAVGRGASTLLLGTSTRSLRRNLERLAAEPQGTAATLVESRAEVRPGKVEASGSAATSPHRTSATTDVGASHEQNLRSQEQRARVVGKAGDTEADDQHAGNKEAEYSGPDDQVLTMASDQLTEISSYLDEADAPTGVENLNSMDAFLQGIYKYLHDFSNRTSDSLAESERVALQRCSEALRATMRGARTLRFTKSQWDIRALGSGRRLSDIHSDYDSLMRAQEKFRDSLMDLALNLRGLALIVSHIEPSLRQPESAGRLMLITQRWVA